MNHALTIDSPGLSTQPTAVAEALQNLQQIVAQCHDAVVIADAQGVITRVNPAFEKLSGYSSNEIVGKDLSLITENGAASSEYQRLWRCVFENKQYAGGLRLNNKSGGSCAIELTITPIRGSRQPIISLVGTARPATETPPSESVVGDARMLHDLRNMLLVLVAHADLALDSLSPEHPARRHVESSRAAAQSAAALAHELTQGTSHVRDVFARGAEDHRTAEPGRTIPGKLQKRGLRQRSGAAQRATILFVEDESLVLESSSEFLRRAGFAVLSAGTGGEAIDLAESYAGRIDLLITDMVLPEVSGPELAVTIAASHPETKVLAISGHPEHYVLKQPGIGSYLAKPFSFSDLDDKVRTILCEKKPPRAVGIP